MIQGPRFSTQAESQWFRMLGWDVVNMTLYPECHLAREAALCYAAVLMITDYDIGVGGVGAVSSISIARVEAEHVEQLDAVLTAAVQRVGPQPEDQCATPWSVRGTGSEPDRARCNAAKAGSARRERRSCRAQRGVKEGARGGTMGSPA